MKKDGWLFGDVGLSGTLLGVGPRVFDSQCCQIISTEYRWQAVDRLKWE